MDFSKETVFNSNKKYFYNASHLNAQGSALFSASLADSLSEMLGQTTGKEDLVNSKKTMALARFKI